MLLLQLRFDFDSTLIQFDTSFRQRKLKSMALNNDDVVVAFLCKRAPFKNNGRTKQPLLRQSSLEAVQ